ncbi:hypothetical protein HMPREF1508_1735 [Shuttleworthella sp. MSX8B]|uniref:hypothetical protein n=1 Tax=Shuttleworthella sp. MSX8B TaxID=936574 RepID=UPI0004484EE2|nr:hypothetical protein [Shuttleworthia sp. MSX8B]EUB19037.1 hypothetical protein HMPREF1508_1735 [Shuttleworthia sp. MSX8B]
MWDQPASALFSNEVIGLAGVLSEGMILCAEDAEANPGLGSAGHVRRKRSRNDF